MGPSAHFEPKVPADIVGNQPALKALAAALASDGQRFVLVSGVPGCGKTALCRVAMRDAIVLDVAKHYSQHQQNLHSNPNVQKDPKHLIANFATTKTMDQFVNRAVKVVWIDDVHVASSRDRHLLSCIAAFASNPLASRCKFVLCTDDNQVTKFADLVKATSALQVQVASVTHKHMFQQAMAILTRADVAFDDEQLLRAAKMSNGNWHDFVSNLDHWMQTDKCGIARDMLQGMTSRALVQRMLYQCPSVDDAIHMSEYDCGDMFMLAYENWVHVAKHRLAKKPAKTVCDAVTEIQNAFWNSFLMDAQVGTFDIDYEGKAMSSAYRYGKLVLELAPMRKDGAAAAMTSLVPRLYTGVGRKHPGDLLLPQRGIVAQAGDLLWSVAADCAGAASKDRVLAAYAQLE